MSGDARQPDVLFAVRELPGVDGAHGLPVEEISHGFRREFAAEDMEVRRQVGRVDLLVSELLVWLWIPAMDIYGVAAGID